jgi:DNA mismatch repair protein MutL
MADLIRLLPDAIANQIAAGEVVQRPSSCIKELMENAVDAGATHIQVIVREAGRQFIQVIDNGKGMTAADVRMSIERHATSKISKTEDLFTLQTMGFRGEALASITAVAQVEIKTRRPADELGTILVVEGSVVKKHEPEACPPGTSITVKNLFYNIPARRNFLKGNPVELKHIIEEFIHLSLANPQLAFTLVSEDELIYELTPGKLSHRIVALFGKGYQQQLAVINEEAPGLKLAGYIGRPELSKRTRSEQYFFVNRRFVKNNYLHFAVMNGFEGLLPEGNFPFYAIFIEIDPAHIDVNVHPTKTEIKFIDDRGLYAFLRVAVKHSLGLHQLAPPIDFSANINLMDEVNRRPDDTRRTFIYEQTGFQKDENLPHWESLFNSQGEARQNMNGRSVIAQGESGSSGTRILFQFRNSYLVREVSQGLMFIDQQAAGERVLFDRLMARSAAVPGSVQKLLFPVTLEFNQADFTLIGEMMDEIKNLGFELEVFGKSAYLLTGVPQEFSGREQRIIEDLLEQFKTNRADLKIPVKENIARSLATRGAVKRGELLTREQQESLVAGLFSSQVPSATPDGRPTFFIFEDNQLNRYFA